MRRGADADGRPSDDSGEQVASNEGVAVYPNNTAGSGPHRMRTSDAEREQVAVILRAAMAEGRLDLEEGSHRLETGYAAKFRDELAPLTADLPDGGRAALAETPAARLATRRSMRRHISFAGMVMLLLIGGWILSGAQFFWPIIPIVFLVSGILRHARRFPDGRRHHFTHRVAPWDAPSYQ